MLAAAVFSPFFIPMVKLLNISPGQKVALSGFLVFGLPELASVAAIALLGKEQLQRIKSACMSRLGRFKPQRMSTKRRYYTGVSMMVVLGPVLSVVFFYFPHIIPGFETHRVVISGLCDVLFVAGLFIAGEQLWSKIEAIFRFDSNE
jgi:hypothetical protein